MSPVVRARYTTLVVAGLAVIAPLLLLPLRATAEPAAPSSVAPASSPDASASVSASASAPPVPVLRKLSTVIAEGPIADKPTAAPPYKSWKDAEKLAIDGDKNACTVQLVREWLHVKCDRGDVIDVSLVSGDAAGVALAVAGEEFNTYGDIVLPVRKGKSYIVTVTAASFGKYSSGLPESAALLWVLWPDEKATPAIRLE